MTENFFISSERNEEIQLNFQERCLIKITLKVTNQGFPLSLQDLLFGKPHGVKLTIPAVLGLISMLLKVKLSFSKKKNFFICPNVSCLKNDETAFSFNLKALFVLKIFFFNCYLAVPRPTLGHSQGDSLTNLMLITAFLYMFDPKVTGSLVTRLGP